MDYVVRPRVLRDGTLVWLVRSADAVEMGSVDEHGHVSLVGHPDACTDGLKALLGALSEWYAADDKHYGGLNAAKMRREVGSH
jgi:hypothetical protein